MPALSVDTLNRAGVSIEVSPGSSLATADAIEDVVLKRGDTIIRAIASNVEPRTIENAMGFKRELSVGSFTFDMAALQPTGSVTIVCIGRRDNYEVTLTATELSYLR